MVGHGGANQLALVRAPDFPSIPKDGCLTLVERLGERNRELFWMVARVTDDSDLKGSLVWLGAIERW
jgi:hypothetical protein